MSEAKPLPEVPMHTKEEVAWGIVDPSLDPVQWFKEHLGHGAGDIHCVWIPAHPKTSGEHPRPDHAVLLCITGNGPQSETNAKRIVELFNRRSPQEPSRGEIEAGAFDEAADRAQIEVNACRHHEAASKGAHKNLHRAAGNVADEIVRFCRAKAAAARGGKEE